VSDFPWWVSIPALLEFNDDHMSAPLRKVKEVLSSEVNILELSSTIAGSCTILFQLFESPAPGDTQVFLFE
jgi:hypothetical protein